MDKSIVLALLCTAAAAQTGQHVFISTPKTWPDAQSYCRQHYTDLSFVGSQSDQDKLLDAAGDNCVKGWIGLHRRLDNITAWMWSGGADVTYQNWANGQPDNYMNMEDAGYVQHNGKWNDGYENSLMPFYCFNSTTLQEEKGWDDARAYCQDKHSDLPTLRTWFDYTELLLVLYFNNIREPVWIGLYCLSDAWQWVNGYPLVSRSWLRGDSNATCPTGKRCAAFTKDTGWMNWDCSASLRVLCS